MLLVVTHKDFPFLKYFTDPSYVIISGNYFSDLNNTYLKDNKGIDLVSDCDNISYKNPYFCELGSLYWLWKNNQDEYKGIQHYRRVFLGFGVKFTGGYISTKKPSVFDYLISDHEIRVALKNADFILPQKKSLKKSSRREELLKYIYESDLLKFLDFLKRYDSKIYSTFKTILNSNEGHYYNMFISTGSKYDAYCKWLFNIMFTFEKYIDIKDYDSQHKRLIGYLSELMIDTYILVNNLSFEECRIAFLTNNKKTVLKQFIRNMLDF